MKALLIFETGIEFLASCPRVIAEWMYEKDTVMDIGPVLAWL